MFKPSSLLLSGISSHSKNVGKYSSLQFNSTKPYLFQNRFKGHSKRIKDEDPNQTLFAKFVKKEIELKNIIHEDEECLAFPDVNPKAPTHILIIPKTPIGGASDIEEGHKQTIGHLFYIARKVAEKVGVSESGYRLVINEGENGQQSIRWLHIHLMAGRKFSWPPG